ncbi:MAG TPA: penicillin-binding protein activator [Gammaproteobacteria bacterium]|nr:penicillin-binding protein activator [Gammaproteobacteria bacterium]
MKKITLILLLSLSLISCDSIQSASSSSTYYSPPAPLTPSTLVNNPNTWRASSSTTWHTLQHTPLPTLQEAAAANQDPQARAWLNLAIISKKYSTNSQQLLNELQTWRSNYPSHPGNQLFPADSTLNQLSTQVPPKHIAVLLPLQGSMSASGQTVRSGFLSAYYDNIGKNPEKQVVSFYDTNGTADLAVLYQKAVDEGADLVVGPLTKTEVEALHNLNHFNVPVLALNYSTPSFFHSLPANLYEFGLSPVEETKQMSNKARQAGLSQALVIASDNDWGHRVVDALNSEWKGNGGNIMDTLYFTKQSNLTQDIASLLHINTKEDQALTRENNSKAILSEQRRHDFNVIFLFAQPETARQIVPLLRFYYAGNVPIYSISTIYSGRPNPIKDKDLNGVTFCELPWIIQMSHTSGNPGQYDRLYAIGRDAYLLSQALPRLNLMPNFPIYGATGALDMDQQRIHQRLPWITIHGGRI